MQDKEELLDQIPFSEVEFAENPEPRCPCVLLLDTSASMTGRPIDELNEGLAAFKDELAADSLASRRVEISIITFGPVNITTRFESPERFQPPRLIASGMTPMGSAINKGVELVEERKREYISNGIAYYRPWIFLITDGSPTDEWVSAAVKVKKGEEAKSFAFFAVGVEQADMSTLRKISFREPLMLKGLRFRDLFQWLSNSMKSVSRSSVGDEISLDNPASPGGWATI